MFRTLCWGLSVAVATGSAAAVVTGVWVGVLRPFPPDPEPVDRRAEYLLQNRNAELASELVEERGRHLRTLVLLDQLRRGAILFPVRDEGGEVPAEDRIPATKVPVVEMPLIPRAE